MCSGGRVDPQRTMQMLAAKAGRPPPPLPPAPHHGFGSREYQMLYMRTGMVGACCEHQRFAAQIYHSALVHIPLAGGEPLELARTLTPEQYEQVNSGLALTPQLPLPLPLPQELAAAANIARDGTTEGMVCQAPAVQVDKCFGSYSNDDHGEGTGGSAGAPFTAAVVRDPFIRLAATFRWLQASAADGHSPGDGFLAKMAMLAPGDTTQAHHLLWELPAQARDKSSTALGRVDEGC